jgi:DNA-binding IclR family transcriptional regulator
LAVLGTVAAASSSVSIAEIAATLEMSESTTYRVVQALRRSGLVSRVGRSGVRLGPAVFSLARSGQRQIADDVPMIALPFMKDLVEIVRETVILTVPHGLDVVCLETVEGPQPLHVSFPRLSVAPLYAGSAVAALAHLDARLVSLVIDSARGRHYADGQEVTEQHLNRQIASVLEQGHVVSRGEVDPHATSVGVPLFEGVGHCVAAMSVAAPTERVTAETLSRLIRAIASVGDAISRHLTEHVHLDPADSAVSARAE